MHGGLATFGLARRPSTGERVVAFLIRWGILSGSVWVAAALIDGIRYQGWESIVAIGLILGLVNVLVRPVLFWLTLPLTILTLGLFLLVLNTGMLLLAAWIAGQFGAIAFDIAGLREAFLGALVISVVAWAARILVDPDRTAQRMAG